MKNKKVIVTIATGEKHQQLWEKYAAKSWRRYAEKHHYDIVCIKEPLDMSERASKRSASWQKCLILKDERIAGYDSVVWLDADITINDDTAPCIVSQVDPALIGAVDAWSFPGVSDYKSLHQRMIDYCKRHSLPYFDIGKKYFTDYGMPPVSEQAVQGGVLVLNPRLHSPIMEKIYNEYEDNRPAHWHYEMRPLSYELITNNLVQWVDPRFNYVLENLKLAEYYNKYPKNYLDRILRIVKIKAFKVISAFGIKVWQERLIKEGLEKSYFLHFAGNAKEMVYAEKIINH